MPELGPQISALYRRVLASGEPIVNMEVRGKMPAVPELWRWFTIC